MSEVKLYNQDCIEAMRKIEDNSVDLIVTDPPYNLGIFMKNRDTNLKHMRDNFFVSAGWDNMGFITKLQEYGIKQIQCQEI